MAAFGAGGGEYASIRGVAMEPSALAPPGPSRLFKDSQLTRRARWELGPSGEQEGTWEINWADSGAHGLRGIQFRKLINLLWVE